MKNLLFRFFFGSQLGDNKVLNTGWLLFRLHTGLSIAIHAGFPKMRQMAAPGWFEEQVAGLGFTFPSPAFWAAIAAWGEFIGGLLIAVGLLTRFAALQLLIQFFVIAFIWYDQPEPLSGMYFQQTLFWCFLLLTAGGSGHYSLDRLISQKSRRLAGTGFRKAAIPLMLLFLSMTLTAQENQKIPSLQQAEGSWKGTLTYLDYTSGKPYSLEVRFGLSPLPAAGGWMLIMEYPSEPRANGKDTLRISPDGSQFNGAPVVAFEKKRGIQIIVTEAAGRDGNENRQALIRRTYEISKQRWNWKKEIRFEGEDRFFLRHEYRLRR